MNNYKVGVYFEEGAVLSINADSLEQAREKAMDILDLFGGSDFPDKHKPNLVYRDYTVTDVELRPSE